MTAENAYPSLCDLCLDYLSGICTVEQKAAFERHLDDCVPCKAELEELRIVWEALPAEMERMEPPKGLKSQIMKAVRQHDKGEQKSRMKVHRSIRRKMFMAGAAAAVLVLVAGTLWNVRLYQERLHAIPTLEQALHVNAANIQRIDLLRPQAGQAKDAYGVACIVDNGSSRQFVVYVFGAGPLKGDEAYQVWLIRNGQRTSGGTFRVSDRGVGLLAMPIGSEIPSYEDIGITLEPDDKGDRPRGTKVFGSV